MSVLIGAGTTGNLDAGIYDAATLGRIINSGSTALGSANTVQELNITDTPLAPGDYLMAVQFSSTSGSFFRNAPANDETTTERSRCSRRRSGRSACRRRLFLR